jgi:hypothetical protein
LIADVVGVLSGQFSGLGEGALVASFGGQDLFISYAAGDGNDVALFTAVPEPGAGLMGAILCSLLFLLRRTGTGSEASLGRTGIPDQKPALGDGHRCRLRIHGAQARLAIGLCVGAVR